MSEELAVVHRTVDTLRTQALTYFSIVYNVMVSLASLGLAYLLAYIICVLIYAVVVIINIVASMLQPQISLGSGLNINL